MIFRQPLNHSGDREVASRVFHIKPIDFDDLLLCTGQKPEEPLFLGGGAAPHHPKIRVSMGV